MLTARLLLGVSLVTLAFAPVAATPARGAGAEPGDAGVRRIESLVGEARFREAAEAAPALRQAVLAMRPSSATRRLLVRTELAAGTAALALGQDASARVCFLRALQVDPGFALGAAAPPKVRSALESLREARE